MRLKFPRPIWLLLIAALALVGAGCGGDDGGSSSNDSDEEESSSEPLDEDEFIEQFDESCLETQEDLSDISLTDLEELADNGSDAVEREDEGLADLEEITPPEDLQEDVDELLDVLQERRDLLEEAQAAAEDEDEDEVS